VLVSKRTTDPGRFTTGRVSATLLLLDQDYGVEPSIRPPVFKTLRQRPVSGKHCETRTRLARPVRDSSTRVTAVLICAVHDMVISPIINHEYSTVYSGECAVYVINMHSGDHQLVTAHHLHHITITRKTTCT